MKTSTIISLVNGTLLMTIVLLEYTKIIDFSLILSYQWHKILHIFGVSLFMVNMIVGPVWFLYAYNSKNKEVLKFADKLLQLTDLSITIPGLDLAVINGLFLASALGGSSNQPWLQYSIYLMIITFLLTYLLLLIQEKIYNIIDTEPSNRDKLQKWIVRWSLWGVIVMIPPTVIFYLMIIKGL